VSTLPIGLPEPGTPARFGRDGWQFWPPVLAGSAALLVIVLGWHGVDWPAQLYRVHLFRAYGWLAFDTGWYGGHSPITYSLLFPPLAALVGVRSLAIVCAAVAAWAFDRLVRAQYGSRGRLGSLCFAAGTVTQVLVGRLTFLLGVALALVALLLMRSGRSKSATVLAVLCALASSMAALLLALAAGAVALTSPSRRPGALLVAIGSVAPIALVSLVYPQEGTMPYPATSLICVLVVSVLALLIVPRNEHTLRIGVVIYMAVSITLFLLPTPIGGNITRLATTVSAPLLVCIATGWRRLLLSGLAIFVVGWQFAPAVGAIGVESRDPSTRQRYFTPLVNEIKERTDAPTRLEIPFTREHWEATWVAQSVSLARGWERQLDIANNRLFYRDGALTASTYHDWLVENGVEWVALPDAPLDYSAKGEAALLERGLPYLAPVWHDAHWRLWRVEASPGLVSGPAKLTALQADEFTLSVREPGAVTVRIRATRTWRITHDAAACVTKNADGWTVVQALQPGTVRVASSILPTSPSRC
jgi:hypothetical protein